MRYISDTILQECCVFYYEEKQRREGQWKIFKKILFPGYIFVRTDALEALYLELQKVPETTKLIGTGREIIPLNQRELKFLERFVQKVGTEKIVPMSEGIICGSRTVITSGPLMGMEGYIRKIDRHKRKAWLEVDMFGRKQNIQIGLEIVSKIPEE